MPNRLLSITIAAVVLKLAIVSSAHGNTSWAHTKTTRFTFDPNAETMTTQVFDKVGWVPKSDHNPPQHPKVGTEFKKTVKNYRPDPNGNVILKHRITKEWPANPNDPIPTTFSVERLIDPNNPGLGSTGFSTSFPLTFEDFEMDVPGVGIFTPTASGIVPITQLGTLAGVGSLLDDQLAPGASGDVPYVTFDLPPSAVVPEPATLVPCFIAIAIILGRRRS